MALVYRLNAIVRKGRLAATFLLHDFERDKSYAIDSSFDANLREGPWEFTTMAAAGDLLCVRGRHPMQRDVLMLCSPEQQAWKRLPLCNTVKRLKRVGMSFQKDDDSYKVLAVELDGEKMVTEVFDSKLEAWSTRVQQEKQFHSLLGRCEFSQETQEFCHLVVKEEISDVDRDKDKVYSMIRYKESLGGWRIVDMHLPARMCDSFCEDDHHEGYDERYTERCVRKASLIGNGNSFKPGLKLLLETSSTSTNDTYDFFQWDTLVYEYDKAAGKWQTMFLCSCTDPQYSWKEKANKRKYRWFKEGSRWYPAVIGTSGRKNAVKIDCDPGSDSESDIGSGENIVPPILVPEFDFQSESNDLYVYSKHVPSKRLPRRKLPRGGGDPRMKPSEEACTLMLDSLDEDYCKRFGHGNKVFMVSDSEPRIVMYDCVSHEFRVLHLNEPCVLRKEGYSVSQFANWDPVCVDVRVHDSNFWKQHGFSVQESEGHKTNDSDNKVIRGNGLLIYDMTSMVAGDGRLLVNLMVHDVVEDKSAVIHLVYNAGLQDVMWKIETVAAAGCFLCFRCSHAIHKDMYAICKPACNSWKLLPPIPIGSELDLAWDDPTVGMYVDDTQASFKVLVSKGEETVLFDSEDWSWSDQGNGQWIRTCKFDSAFGGFLAFKDGHGSPSSIAKYVAESCEWKPTGIELLEHHRCSPERELFGSQDRTLLMMHVFGTARSIVYGVNAKESRFEPVLLNRQFVAAVGGVTGATILEDLKETEARELVLEATECFCRGDRMFWAKREDERVAMYDFASKQFKVLHIVKPWGKYKDGHRRVLRIRPSSWMESCYAHSVYLCSP